MIHITDENIEQSEETAVTLGNFDGIHLGHRTLISLTKKLAEENNLKSAVFSFTPHPMFLFGNRKTKALIMSSEEKSITLESMGIDIYIEYPFTKEFAAMEPEIFARDIIFGKMKCRKLVVGDDYRFGAKARGDYELLKSISKEFGADVYEVSSVDMYGSRVSSTRIREALNTRDIPAANKLLSVPYFVYGKVQNGKHLGRKFKFPTANIEADEKKLYPPDGVYATKTIVDGKEYMSITNIGTNPTVNGKKRTVETNMFDFDKEIYGKNIKTYFYKSIRAEKKFSDVNELYVQIEKDKKAAKEYFLTYEFKETDKKTKGTI
ncbi:MAG: bifunctional riboflavin kinase/FAD synthetase [Clostridia bacterium]|jgi:riboflavin kinase/FMN adenylyltransferase|nr:bifunctional riboflavin kinase/FAD synthetase [Clostridia bacterium]MCI2000149.1 bifunctional riboflavin kinase/FAD synthetase [Clostridia bacterium]MCI2014686.1 bifunctional riboflavin kinase/FAD synthetase [Clostridia bacterium]